MTLLACKIFVNFNYSFIHCICSSLPPDYLLSIDDIVFQDPDVSHYAVALSIKRCHRLGANDLFVDALFV